MSLEYFRIDDRLIHGQVVVGWGQPCSLGFVVLVDETVVASDWEKELYRMGVPPEMELYFESVESAAARMPTFRADERAGLLLTGDIATMSALVAKVPGISTVTLGGIHHHQGRTPRLRYVFLTPVEEGALRAIEGLGVDVTAQDVPSARPVPLDELLNSSLDG